MMPAVIRTLERSLTLIAVIGWLAVISGTEAVVATRKPANGEVMKSKMKNLCFTTECFHTASAVLSKMNPDVSPCNDFYQFACGNYIAETEIPENENEVSTSTAAIELLNTKVRQIMTEERPDTDPKYTRLPNALYKGCMREFNDDNVAKIPVQRITESWGGWPVLVGKSWDSNNSWSWQETHKKSTNLGFGIHYMMWHYISRYSQDNGVIVFSLPDHEIEREHLVKGFNDTLVSAYYDYIVDIAVLFGADKEIAKMELKESLQFEIDLAKIASSADVQPYNELSIKQLQETYPYIQWLDYINGILSGIIKVDENEPIKIQEPSFFEELGKLVQRTNKRTIANYMIYRLHVYVAPLLPEEFRMVITRFKSITEEEKTPRWKKCEDIVSSLLYDVMNTLQYKMYLKPASEIAGLEIVNNIRDAYNDIFDEVAWMDDITKEKAKKKLHGITTHLGGDRVASDDELQEKFNHLQINFDNFLNMTTTLTLSMFHEMVSSLRKKIPNIDYRRVLASPSTIAGYFLIRQGIMISPGYIGGSYFNSQRPEYMNYGGIGGIISDAIIRGLASNRFNLKGAQKDYLEKGRCIAEQYGNYTDQQTGLNLNGNNTRRQNIADNFAFRASYLGYNKWVAKNGKEPRLPGLYFSPQQLFWISSAQSLCAKYETDFLRKQITTGAASPNEFRVLGSFTNSNEFSNDFKCAEGTPMNPVKKCQFW